MGLVAPRHVGSSLTEPVSPALAGGFLTTAPPGKSRHWRSVRALLDCPAGPGNWMVLHLLLFLTKEETLGLQESVISLLLFPGKSPKLSH